MNRTQSHSPSARAKSLLRAALALIVLCVPQLMAQDKVNIHVACTLALGGGTLPGQGKVEDSHRVTVTVTTTDANGNPQDVTVKANIGPGGTARAVGALLAGAMAGKGMPGATVADQNPAEPNDVLRGASQVLTLPAGVKLKSTLVEKKKAEGFGECNAHLKVDGEKKKNGTDEGNGPPPPISNMALMTFATDERSAYALDLELTLEDASGNETTFAFEQWFALGTPFADARLAVVAAAEEFGLVAFSEGPFLPWILIDANASGLTITSVRFGASTSFPEAPTLPAGDMVAAYSEFYLF
jgi:hypothetical protein